MIYQSMMQHHEAATSREERAAARATCIESVRAHYLLADLHRNEAAKMNAVRATLSMTFGD